MRIPALIVDADPTVQPAMREAEALLAIPFVTAPTVAAAVRMLRESRAPALVVVDAGLHDGGAIALCDEIRRTPRLHHVPIVVTSRPDADVRAHAAFAHSVGATFTHKPIVGSAFADLARRLLERANAARRWRGRPRMLIADDDDDLRAALAAVAIDEGWDPLCVADGEEALAMCGTAAPMPRLALVDWILPGRDGVEVATQIANESMVVLMSGRTEIVQHAARVGAAAVLKKPFPLEHVVGLMARAESGTIG